MGGIQMSDINKTFNPGAAVHTDGSGSAALQYEVIIGCEISLRTIDEDEGVLLLRKPLRRHA